MREDFQVVAGAYRRLVESGTCLSLVVAGVRQGHLPYIESLLSRHTWRDRVVVVPFLQAGEERSLAELCAAALFYLDPSLKEGFGMQVIEAMACGTAVVCSNRGALPEVAGDAACLVDPFDVESIRTGILKVMTDRHYRERLVQRGFENVKRFSPASIAARYEQIHEEVLSGALG